MRRAQTKNITVPHLHSAVNSCFICDQGLLYKIYCAVLQAKENIVT